MKRIPLALSCVLAVMMALPVSAATDTKEAKVRELLRLTKSAETALQGVDQMIQMMKGSMPQSNEEFWTKLRAEIRMDEYIDQMVPVYLANFDEADLDALIQFYQSPAGKRLIEKQPAILQQSMAIGQKWGQQLAAKVLQQMNAKQ